METKSGAQKLSDFSSQLGSSELGESHTATRLDGESMQGENTAQLLGAEAKAKQAMGVMFAIAGLNIIMGLAIVTDLFASGGGSGDGMQMLLVGACFLGLAMWTRRDAFSGSLAGLTMYAGYRIVTMVMSGSMDMRSMAFTIAIAGVLAFAVRETHRSLVSRGRRPEFVKPAAAGVGLVVLCVAVAMMTATTCNEGVDCQGTAGIDDDETPNDETPNAVTDGETPPTKVGEKADKVVAPATTPAKPKGVKAAAGKPTPPAKATTAKPKGTKAAVAGKGAKAKPAKAAKAKPAKAKAGKGKAVAKAGKGAKAKGKTKPH